MVFQALAQAGGSWDETEDKHPDFPVD